MMVNSFLVFSCRFSCAFSGRQEMWCCRRKYWIWLPLQINQIVWLIFLLHQNVFTGRCRGCSVSLSSCASGLERSVRLRGMGQHVSRCARKCSVMFHRNQLATIDGGFTEKKKIPQRQDGLFLLMLLTLSFRTTENFFKLCVYFWLKSSSNCWQWTAFSSSPTER